MRVHTMAGFTWRAVTSVGFFLGFASAASAAGFALIEQSASGLGNAFAGGAAIAEDPSTVYFNPAGLTRLSGTQVSIAGHVIAPSAQFGDGGATLNPLLGGSAISGGDGGEGGVTGVSPNFYYVNDFGGGVIFGLGINVPFGLATSYDKDWVGRYHAIDSDVKTVNINPSLAFRVDDRLSLGFGVSAQYLKATLTNAIDFGTICYHEAGPLTCGAVSPQNADGRISVEGDSWGVGFNLGLLYELTEATRVGFAYRSSVSHDLKGDGDFTVPANFQALLDFQGSTLFSDTGASAGIDLPETVSLSLYHDLSPQWALMGDVTWTRWSRFDQLVVEFDNPDQPDNVQPENWKNNWRFSLGATYRPNTTWTLRAGVAYDQTPIPSAEHRTPRIPGNDRTWLAIGAGYRASERLSFDVGYAHLFVDDTPIDDVEVNTGHRLKGSYDNSVDIISAQMNWKFN